MAITPTCDKCGSELTEFGAILLSPPNADNDVHKYHLCVACYESMVRDMLPPLKNE